MNKRLTRRELLKRGTQVATALGLSSSFSPLWAASDTRRFAIGACDWSIGKMGNPDALAVAREIGLDGVQVSLGTAKDDMQLRKPEVQKAYLEAGQRSGVKVASLAIGELNEIPYKSDSRTVAWVSDSITACHDLGCQVILLAFFGNGDLKNDQKGVDEVVRRLKEVAPKAEKAGVILGVESWLSAEEHMNILQRVGSTAVKVYYDVCNSNQMGYDIYREIRWLGKQKAICEFHAKENGFLLGQGKVDFQKVRQAIDEIEFRGWIQIEGAVPKDAQMLPSYQANLKFLRGIFNA